MEAFTRIVLVIAGAVHLLPAIGVLGASRLQHLYSVAIDDPNLVLMLQHRALLFGVLGAGLLAAAWLPAIRTAMIAAGLISTAGFCLLVFTAGEANPALRRVAWIDVPIAIGLAVAFVVHLRGTMTH